MKLRILIFRFSTFNSFHYDVYLCIKAIFFMLQKSAEFFCKLFFFGNIPSSIYSCSIDHFLEHEICHLGCLGRNKKFLKRPNFCLSMQLFRVVFSTFWLSIEQLYIELGYFSVRIQKLHNIAGLSEAGGPGGLSYKLKIGYHSRFFGRKS